MLFHLFPFCGLGRASIGAGGEKSTSFWKHEREKHGPCSRRRQALYGNERDILLLAPSEQA